MKAARGADVIAVAVPEGTFLLDWNYRVTGFIPSTVEALRMNAIEPPLAKSIALSSDGTTLAVSSIGEIDLFALPGGSQLQKIQIRQSQDQISENCRVNEVYDVSYNNPADLSFAPDGRSLLSAVGNCILVWNVTTGALLRSFSGYYEIRGKRYPSQVTQVEFSPDGNYFIFRARPGDWMYREQVKRSEAEDLYCLWQLSAEKPTCYPAVAGLFSWDSSLLVLGGGHGFGTQFYRAVDFSRVRTNTDRWIRKDNCMALSPDNKHLAECSSLYGRTKNPVIIWNVRTWKLEYIYSLDSSPMGVLFSPKEESLLVWTDILLVWNWTEDNLWKINISKSTPEIP